MHAQFIFLLILAPVAFLVSIADLHGHKIPNIYLKVISVLTGLIIFLFGLGSLKHLLIWMIILSLLLIARVGMGDIKLVLLLALCLNSISSHHEIDFLVVLVLAALLHFSLESLIYRRVSKEIALAPSIFFALLTYLATS